jgi:hypothetical protein
MEQTLPTFTFLANAGIMPSTTQTFTLAQLTSALKTQSVSIPLSSSPKEIHLDHFPGIYARS